MTKLHPTDERWITRISAIILLLFLVFKLAVFGGIAWLIYILLQHFGVIGA